MYRLLVSFNKGDFLSDTWKNPKEYLLSDEKEVCDVIVKLSRFNPVITLCQIPVLSSADVLEDLIDLGLNDV